MRRELSESGAQLKPSNGRRRSGRPLAQAPWTLAFSKRGIPDAAREATVIDRRARLMSSRDASASYDSAGLLPPPSSERRYAPARTTASVSGRRGTERLQGATDRSSESPGAHECSATAAVVSPRLADGCFTPAMHKPSRSRPRHLPRYCFSTALGRPPARSDRPASAVRLIAMRGMESCRSCQRLGALLLCRVGHAASDAWDQREGGVRIPTPSGGCRLMLCALALCEGAREDSDRGSALLPSGFAPDSRVRRRCVCTIAFPAGRAHARDRYGDIGSRIRLRPGGAFYAHDQSVNTTDLGRHMTLED